MAVIGFTGREGYRLTLNYQIRSLYSMDLCSILCVNLFTGAILINLDVKTQRSRIEQCGQ